MRVRATEEDDDDGDTVMAVECTAPMMEDAETQMVKEFQDAADLEFRQERLERMVARCRNAERNVMQNLYRDVKMDNHGIWDIYRDVLSRMQDVRVKEQKWAERMTNLRARLQADIRLYESQLPFRREWLRDLQAANAELKRKWRNAA